VRVCGHVTFARQYAGAWRSYIAHRCIVCLFSAVAFTLSVCFSIWSQRQANKTTKELCVAYTEETVTGRLPAARGPVSLPQREYYSFISHVKMGRPQDDTRSRIHYPGTTMGDAIIGVPYFDIEAKHIMATHTVKKAIFIDRVYGQGVTMADGNEKVPVFDSSLPRTLAEELMHIVGPTRVWDLSPSDTKRAVLCVMKDVHYTAVLS
jgi:hypothetical protein